MTDPYEQDREDNAVNERDQWAEDHGYSRYRCPVHGTFWSDVGPHCEQCPEEISDEEADAEQAVATEIVKLIWLAEFSQNCKHLGSVMRALKETN